MKKITELVTSPEKPEQRAKRKAITFGSFKRAEDKQVAERKQREHDAELAVITEEARIQRVLEEEEQKAVKEENRRRREKFITKSLSNAFGTKNEVDMTPVREQVIDRYLPKTALPEAEEYPTPFKDEPALNAELAEFKKKINEHLHTIGFASSGGGGIGSIADANDLVDGIGDGEFLQFRASDGKFIGATASVTTLALSKLDIDGGTDIGAAIVDADLFVVDDGAGGTNRKTAASRIKTYVADVTLTTAAQTNITSVGTLTALQVDNLNLNGNTLSSTAGTDLLITPLSGQQIVLDGTIIIDAGVVTGATSITSTAFVGGLTGDVTGNVSGTAATVTTAAQTNITSLGTLTALTVDNIVINGANIGHTSDTDAIAIASDGDVTLSQNLVVTGDFTVNGTTTTVSTTNMKVSDTLLELNTGASSNANDMGIIMERGSTGDNAIFMFDESADEFTVGTTTATNDATGNISVTAGTFTAATLKGNLVVADDGDVGSASATDAMQISSAGIVTFKDDILIKDGGTIGVASSTSAITIASTGIVTLVDDLLLKDACTIGTATTAGAIAIAADGTVDLDTAGATVASAVIKTAGLETIWVPSAAMRPTVSNGCAALTEVETTAGRPDLQVLDFDKDADEAAQFQIAFPKSWNEGTITFAVYYIGLAATTGVAFGLQGVSVGDNEEADQAYGTAVVVTDDSQGDATEVLITATSGAVTLANSPAAGDISFFRLFRDVSDGNDDMAGDARVLGVKIFFTTNAANDA